MKFRSAKFKRQRRSYSQHFHTPIRIFLCTHASAVTMKLEQTQWVLPSSHHGSCCWSLQEGDWEHMILIQALMCRHRAVPNPAVLLPCTQHHHWVEQPSTSCAWHTSFWFAELLRKHQELSGMPHHNPTTPTAQPQIKTFPRITLI